MSNTFIRTQLLIGAEGLEKLHNAKVAVFGIGGVGSFAAEALARAGVGHLVLVDHDRICPTNINRQLPATQDTVGQLKVDIMAQRIAAINPKAKVQTHALFYTPQEGSNLLNSGLDYVIDAVDTVTAKLDLIVRCRDQGIPIVSSMGAGNRVHPEQLEVADISETHTCPLARVVRRELRKRGISQGVPVVFSEEIPLEPLLIPGVNDKWEPGRKKPPGSISFVPPVAGMILAGVVVRHVAGLEG